MELAGDLLAWYDANRRELPWRDDPTPYHVWISEIMLQQTRVETVKEYYRRFTQEFPSIQSLARATENQYLKMWEGLGYYSRVRNLHRAAVQICETYGGELPCTSEELKKLPGIGAYTSAAIASICFGETSPAIDGNLLRVFARLTMYEQNCKTAVAQKEAYNFWKDYIPADRPGDFNQALMDLGSGICAPGANADCVRCPISRYCQGYREGKADIYPVMPEKKSRGVEKKTVFLICVDDRVAIQKRPSKGLLAGLYEFPSAKGWLNQSDAIRWLREHAVQAVRLKEMPEARHIFTHKEWHMTGYEVMVDATRESEIPFLMVRKENLIDQYAIPSAFASYVERIRMTMI